MGVPDPLAYDGQGTAGEAIGIDEACQAQGLDADPDLDRATVLERPEEAGNREGGRHMIDPEVQSVCEEFGITIIPANVAPQIGQTRAPATLEKIKRKHGIDHMRFVVGLLAETANNKAVLTEDVFWATSDVVKAFQKNFPSVYSNDVEKIYAFFDVTPIGVLQYWCLSLEGITSKRRALVGQLWERAIRTFGPLYVQPDLLDDRRRA